MRNARIADNGSVSALVNAFTKIIISEMMILVNAFTNAETLPLSAMRAFLILLSPFAPHIASELWGKLSAKFVDVQGAITDQRWPDYDPKFLVEDEVEMVIQVNGK